MPACSQTQTQLQSASPKTLIVHAMLLDADLADFKPGELLMENSVITAIGEPNTLSREDRCVIYKIFSNFVHCLSFCKSFILLCRRF